MSRSRTPFVLGFVLVVAVVLTWFALATDDTMAIPDHAPLAGVEADVPQGSGGEPDLAPATSELVRRASERADPRLAARLVGLTWADVFVVSTFEDQAPIEDYTVVAIAASGARHNAHADDALRVDDVAPPGLIVVRAEGRCARWIDPSAVAEHLLEGTSARPLALELVAAARITIVSTTEALDHVELTTSDAQRMEFAYTLGAPDAPDSRFHAFERFAADLRALADGSDDEDTQRAERLARVRASRHLPAVVRPTPDGPDAPFEPWVARLVPIAKGEPLVFDSVPTHVPIRAVLPARAYVDLEIERSGGVEFVRTFGGNVLADLDPRPFEVLMVRVLARAPASVRGIFASGAQRSRVSLDLLTLDTVAPAGDPKHTRGGSFAWSNLPPGRYHFTSSWIESDGAQARHARTFELASGEDFDLGVLQPLGANVLVVPRFVVVDMDGVALAVQPPLPEVTCYVQIHELQPELELTPQAWSIEAAPGRDTLLRGVNAGEFQVTAQQLLGSPEDLARWRSRQVALTTFEGGATPVLEIDVPLVAVAPCRIEVPVPPRMAVPGLTVHAWFVHGDGALSLAAPPFHWEATPDGGGRAWAVVMLDAGEWTLLTRLTAPPTDTESRVEYYVAEQPAHVATSGESVAVVTLVDDAEFEFVARAPNSRAEVRRMLELALSVSRGDLSSDAIDPVLEQIADGEVLVRGLVPDRDHTVAGTIVRTGAPGSTTRVE